MIGDIKIKRLVTEIRELTNEWALESNSCRSDRIVEIIIDRARELEATHEKRFDSCDVNEFIKII